MTTEGYEYLVSIKDELTANTNEMVKGLTRLELALKKTDEAAERANDAIKKVGSGGHGLASGISYAVRSFDDLRRGGGYAANGLLDAAKAAERLGPGGVIAGIGIAALAADVGITALSLEMSEFKKNTTEAYEVLGGGGGAKKFEQLDALSESIHAPAVKVHEFASSLMSEGLTNQEALYKTVRAVTDLQRVGLDSGAQKIQSIVSRSLAEGHLDIGKKGRGLAGTGVTEDALASVLGVSRKKLDADLKSGKISVEQGIQAIDDVIIKGKIGDLAQKKFTATDAFADLHNAIRKTFQDADASPLTDALKEVSEGFRDGSDNANTLKDIIQTTIEAGGGLIRWADDLKNAFSEDFQAAKDAASSAFDWIVAHDPTHSAAEKAKRLKDIHFGEHMMAREEAVQRQQKAQSELQGLANSGASVSELAKAAKRKGVEITLVDRPRENASKSELDAFRTKVKEYGDMSDPNGHPIHDERIVKPVHKLGVDAAKGMIEGARGSEGFDAHSPSRKMFDIGVDAAEGLQGGAAAAASLYAPDEGRADPRSSPGRSAPSVKVDVGGLHFQGHLDLEDFGPLLESMVADVFERAALELGQ